MLIMLCMVFQMLPNTVFAETISGNGNTYIGSTRVCPNNDLIFSYTTDNIGDGECYPWIGKIDKIDKKYLIANDVDNSNTCFAVISKNGIQEAYSQSSSFFNYNCKCYGVTTKIFRNND